MSKLQQDEGRMFWDTEYTCFIAARVKCVHISVICISTLSIYQMLDYACPVKCIIQDVSEKMTLWFIVKVLQTDLCTTFNLVFLYKMWLGNFHHLVQGMFTEKLGK